MHDSIRWFKCKLKPPKKLVELSCRVMMHLRLHFCEKVSPQASILGTRDPFTVGNKHVLWSKLMKEIKNGHVAGPYNSIPFKNFMQSPIGLVPKDGGAETRLNFHLSYDFPNGGSLNANTPAELCTVCYNNLDVAVNMCLWVAISTASHMY